MARNTSLKGIIESKRTRKTPLKFVSMRSLSGVNSWRNQMQEMNRKMNLGRAGFYSSTPSPWGEGIETGQSQWYM